MKSKKVVVAMILVMLFSILPVCYGAARVKSVRLNKKRITLTIGKKAKLKVIGKKGKVTWSSSSKRIATVSGNGAVGVVKALREGTCSIRAKHIVRKKTITMSCRVKVIGKKNNYINTTIETNPTYAVMLTQMPTVTAAVETKSSEVVTTLKPTVVPKKNVTEATAVPTERAEESKATAFPTNSTVVEATTTPTNGTAAEPTTAPTEEATEEPINISKDFAGGKGTKEDPYIVENITQLKAITNYPTSCFKQVADISINYESMESLFDANNPFCGVYDGASNSITELNYNNPDGYGYSMFGYLGENAKILNLNVKDCVVTAKAGCIFVYENKGTIENCILEDDVVNTKKENTALLCANNKGTIKSCSANGSIVFKVDYVMSCGMITGVNDGNIFDCISRGNIKGSNSRQDGWYRENNNIFIGGIAGTNNGLIKKCEDHTGIDASTSSYGYPYVAGIAAWNDGQVIGCSVGEGNRIVEGGNGIVN